MPSPLPQILLVIAVVAMFFAYRWVSRKIDAAPGRAEIAERRARRKEARAERPEPLSAESLAHGFRPVQAQDTASAFPADPAVTAALEAARTGDWVPAAELLARTGRDWERRSLYVAELGSEAAEDDGWLRAWEAARPDDPDAAVVRADGTSTLAGKVRGAARADHTTREQFDGFHRLMVRARTEMERAAELAPADPVPLIRQIRAALALRLPHADMDRLWTEITARAPFHYSAHYSALQYWCAKWHGSKELATAFAARAAASAPPGHLLTALPLISWYEHRDDVTEEADHRAPELVAAVDALLADVAAAPADHCRRTEVRHLLAYFLTHQKRYPEALEQFRLIEGHIGALPWSYEADPAEVYVALREVAVAGAEYHAALAERDALRAERAAAKAARRR